jgi:hypothetical protein
MVNGEPDLKKPHMAGENEATNTTPAPNQIEYAGNL